MSKFEEWNIIASGTHGQIHAEVCEHLQHGDRYEIVFRIANDELIIVSREFTFLGIWLGMLSLEMGRSIDQSSSVEGVTGDTLRLARELASGTFQLEYESPVLSRAIALSSTQAQSLRIALEQVLQAFDSI